LKSFPAVSDVALMPSIIVGHKRKSTLTLCPPAFPAGLYILQTLLLSRPLRAFSLNTPSHRPDIFRDLES
jgi:hypothetical protein